MRAWFIAGDMALTKGILMEVAWPWKRVSSCCVMLRGGMALAKDAFIEVMLPDDMVAWTWRRVPSWK